MSTRELAISLLNEIVGETGNDQIHMVQATIDGAVERANAAGFRAGVEAAAKYIEGADLVFFNRLTAARAIRALTPAVTPRDMKP